MLRSFITFFTIAVLLQAMVITEADATSRFLMVKQKYCNSVDYHCIFVSADPHTAMIKAKDPSLVPNYGTSKKTGMTVYAVKNGGRGHIQASCKGKVSTVSFGFSQDGQKGTAMKTSGDLNGIFHSNVGIRLEGGRLHSRTVGDDLDIYCPAT